MSKLNLIGLSLSELKDAFAPLGLEPFRAKQVWAWLYVHGARSFEQMTTLAKPAREKLEAAFSLARPEIVIEQKSVDGTRKWLLRFEDGQEVECVYIPEEDRGALCVSSQVGCPMGCAFCRTGTQKLTRNLTAGEIVAQVMIARDVLDEWPSTKEPRMLSNIVMMGMGEPLHNYENVAKAIKIMMDEGGIAIGRRRITLSTCGVVPLIERCGAELGVNLAISLHATTDDVRDRLMPVNRKYPIAQLIQACRDYPAAKNARRITFEYVMLKGINDSLDDARRLVKLVAGLPAKINLLPYNAWEGSPFETSAPETLQAFADLINKAGYASPVRTPRGRDILAACGQLKSASERACKKRGGEEA